MDFSVKYLKSYYVSSREYKITVITLTKKHDHITPVLKELHRLPVRKRIEFKIQRLAYKCLHGTAPSYLRELLKEYVPRRTLRSTSKNLLFEPRTNMKTYSDRLFSAGAPKLWNQLPNNIKIWTAGSVAIFKQRLKPHLFEDIYINRLCGYQHLSFDNGM